MKTRLIMSLKEEWAVTSFNEVLEKNIKRLEQFVPVVDRVHGEHHPEFHEVRRLFEEINRKIKEAGSGKPDLDNEFKQLKEITNNYTVPEDVCETYEAVYNMLAEMDRAHRE